MRTGATSIGTVAVGALVSGAASVAGLAVATRAVGRDEAGPLAVAWALAVVVGPGLWSSVEQEAARATARGEDTAALARLVGRRAAAAVVVVAVAGLAARHQVFRGTVAVPLALAAAAAAYGPLHLAWGRMAGAGRSRALAVSIAAEGIARLALVGGTAAVTHRAGWSAAALAAAVAMAAVVATAIAARSHRVPTGSHTPGVGERVRSLTWVGLLSQGLFLTSPAVFELLAPPGDGRTARLAMAVVVARAPALAWKGVLAVVVPAVAASGGPLGRWPEAAAVGRPARSPGRSPEAAVGRAVAAGVVVAAGVGASLAAIAGDAVLDLLTGSGPDLGRGSLALLATATAAYLGALTASSALAGAGRTRVAAATWALAGIVFVAVAAIPGDPLRRVVTALVAGTVVALTVAVAACVRRPGTDSEDGLVTG